MNIKSAAVVGCLLLGAFATAVLSEDPPIDQQRAAAQKLLQDGNFKDAYDGFRKLALDPKNDGPQVVTDLNNAVQALRNLGRVDEVDDFREGVIEQHAKNWRLLQGAGDSYLAVENYGQIIAGKYYRGNRRGGGGQWVNAADRDRVRALQLMVQAMPLVAAENDKGAAGQFYLSLARMMLSNRGSSEAWRLQYLTDLTVLPDYEQGWNRGGNNRGAPVDADGNPVFHQLPAGLDKAETDGQRWRWALAQAADVSPGLLNTVRWELATFLDSQFGVQTMAYYGYRIGRGGGDEKEDQSGPYALEGLSEEETIARLASGIKRFKLPDEFNYLKIYQKMAAEPQSGLSDQALDQLAMVFENRRQYVRAAEYWREAIKLHGPGQNNVRQLRLDQIVKNWGRFEIVQEQPAGIGATFEFRYRNGNEVHFDAQPINVEKLLGEVKDYIKTKPAQLDWQRLNIGNIGYLVVEQGRQDLLGEKVASWDLDLEPSEKHFDDRVTVTTPLQKSGAYWVTAQMADGNTAYTILWLSDTALVKKPMEGKTYYLATDSVTGAPIAKANLEFFGYRQRRIDNTNNFVIETQNYSEFTDADGQVFLPNKPEDNQYQWLVTARTKEGRFVHLGFTNMWAQQYHDQEYNQAKVFTITDRPVYRPKQTVKFKFWVRHARYDQDNNSTFADQEFPVVIQNPKGDKILEKNFKADAYGGFEGELELPADATLGVYQMVIPQRGGGNFRVEEYKKPEFEVTVDAPTEPVLLGEKVSSKITARYYFGSPVTKAKVKYKVLRMPYTEQWYPVAPWDWFYGRGYWWFSYDYTWLRGWGEWGCKRPAPFWWGMGRTQPEVVTDAEVEIGPDGTVPVEIDTSLAKAIHGDQDHQYQIVAEVVDDSRRTIVGQGNVLVARKPFKVFAWVDRGYYRVGDTVRANFQAHTLNQKPVQGTGQLELFKISYDEDREPVETSVRKWDLNTNDQGQAKINIKASKAGQYRLSYKLTDKAQHTIEGGYVFTIIGQGFDGSDYRFDALELIPDKADYAPGEKVKLMINTDRVGSTVALFIRPANGVYLPPKILRMQGKSMVEEIEVARRDMPNFFIEAVTIADGKLHFQVKEVVVPPEQRMLNVDVQPSAAAYKPGESAKVRFKLTDFHGKPFVGSSVVAIYDKSVEYIAGGSNVADIKEFFWKWRRSHHPHNESTLGKASGNMGPKGQPQMGDLGVFGASVADEQRQNRRGAEEKGKQNDANRKEFAGREMQMAGAKAMANGMADKDGSDRDSLRQLSEGKEEEQLKRVGEAGPAPLAEATVRKNFADTALWAASVTTGEDGTAEVALEMPENLTTWKVKVWSMGHGTQVGQGATEVATRKNLIVRMQAPRFFVEKDEVVLSANVHSYLDKPKSVQVSLEIDGGAIAPLTESTKIVELAAGGEARVDWRVKVLAEGNAVIRMKALTDEESDAMQMDFPVHVHGMLKTESWAGAIRPEKDGDKFTLRVPAERRINDSRLEIRYSPTLAGAMVDALPYLAEYPYGCTEQTLNRFLPTVITQKVLLNMGLDLKAIQEKRTNLNAQEIGDDVERAKQWKRFDRNPVFDAAEVQAMVKDGLKALTEMQLSDGGWGWFSGYGEYSYPHTTATVVHGLQVAAQNDVALVPGVLERGVAWLKSYQEEQVRRIKNADGKVNPWKEHADDLDALVFMVLVDANEQNAEMLAFLHRDRTKLAVYSKAMYGLALHKLNDQEKLAMILKNIEQFLVQDEENQTAYLKLPENNYWWHWYGSESEANAYYLKLLSRTDAKGAVASRLVKYILNNRKHATYWNSTRDTALSVEALAEFLKASGESKPDVTVEIWLDGKKHKEVHITAENLFSFDNKFVLFGDAVETGMHTVEFKKRGASPLYYNAYLTNFTLEDHITKAGLELKVNRKFYRLVKVDKKIKVAGAKGQVVDQKVEKYERKELVNLADLKSGELVEVELEIDSKNDYEYLIFEDLKAAGFEPVDLRSGYNGNTLGAYVEFRDRQVSFFVRQLARGKHSVAYRIRAEIPGRFSALPTRAYAMYAPELKANSDEIKLQIED